MLRSLDQYLKSRNGNWHYVRRVPREHRLLDDRGTIRTSLKTRSLEVARRRRDALAEADDLFWATLQTEPGRLTCAADCYAAAKRRAFARGFTYTPLETLQDAGSIKDIVARLAKLQSLTPRERELPPLAETEALLGTARPVSLPVSQAFER